MSGSPFLASGKGTGGGTGLTPEQLDALVQDGELSAAQAAIIAALPAPADAATPQDLAEAQTAQAVEHATTRTALTAARDVITAAITAARDYLKGFIDTLTGKVDAVKAVVDANSTAIAARATQASVDALAGGTTLAAAKTNIIDAVNTQGTSTRNNADASKAEVKQAITDARDHIEAANWVQGESRTFINTSGVAPTGWSRLSGAVSAAAWALARLVFMNGLTNLHQVGDNARHCNNSRYFYRLGTAGGECWGYDTQLGQTTSITPWLVASGALPDGLYADDTWLYTFGTTLVDADVKRYSLTNGNTAWEGRAALPVPVRLGVVAKLGAKIAVIGGSTSSTTSDGTTWTSKVQVLDPVANTFTTFDLPFKGVVHRCCEMPDGSVIAHFLGNKTTTDAVSTTLNATARLVRIKPDNTVETLTLLAGTPNILVARSNGTVLYVQQATQAPLYAYDPVAGTSNLQGRWPFDGSDNPYQPGYLCTPSNGKALAGGFVPFGTFGSSGGATYGLGLLWDSQAHQWSNTQEFRAYKT